MSKLTIHHVRPSEPFTARYDLTISDAFTIQMECVYLYIFKTASLLNRDETQRLTSNLTESIATFVQHPQRSPLDLSELLSTIYQDPATGHLYAVITPSSSIPFAVSDRTADVTSKDLKPESSFPLQPLKPSIFGANMSFPAPDATKGVQALWIQLTLIDGGFVIHVHMHHWIAGAVSAGRFVEAWFERARLLAQRHDIGEPMTFEPEGKATINPQIELSDRQELAKSLNSVTVPQQQHQDFSYQPVGRAMGIASSVYALLSLVMTKTMAFVITCLPFLSLQSNPSTQSDAQIFHFSSKSLQQLRSDVRKSFEKDTNGSSDVELTLNDCLTALIWCCLTHARFGTAARSSEESNLSKQESPQQSTILTPVDYRSRLNPPLRPDCFGNTNVDAHTTLPVSSLVSRSDSGLPPEETLSSLLNYAARKIHQSIAAVTDAHVRSLYQLVASRSSVQETQKPVINWQNGPDILCTSWEHMHRDPKLLSLDILVPNATEKGNRITFETMRYMHVDGIDGLVVILPCFGRKWEESRSDAGEHTGQAASQGGLEVAISLKTEHMRRLMSDPVFARYATWGEDGGHNRSQVKST